MRFIALGGSWRTAAGGTVEFTIHRASAALTEGRTVMPRILERTRGPWGDHRRGSSSPWGSRPTAVRPSVPGPDGQMPAVDYTEGVGRAPGH